MRSVENADDVMYVINTIKSHIQLNQEFNPDALDKIEVVQSDRHGIDRLAECIFEYYLNRTQKHVQTVQIFAKMIADKHSDKEWSAKLLEQAKDHDKDKLTDIEFMANYAPYIVKKYGPEELKCNFELTEGYKIEWERKWVVQHCKNNKHHPEGWDKSYDYGENNPPYTPKLMDEVSICEAIADWMSVGYEQGNSATEWFESNNGTRWIWSNTQKTFIRDILKDEASFLAKIRSASNESFLSEITLDAQSEFIYNLCESLNKYDSNIIDYRKNPPVPSTATTDEERLQFYRLQDPNDTIKWKCGFCWDIALCAITLLKKKGISAYAIYAEQEDGSEFPNNHCTVVYKDKKGLNLFEASWDKHHCVYGSYKYDSKICERLASWMVDKEQSGRTTPITCYRIHNYPKPGCTADEFMTQCRKNSVIGKFYGENSTESNEIHFDTYEDARKFLIDNYRGHGAVYLESTGEMLSTCRCLRRIHDEMHIPKVYSKARRLPDKYDSIESLNGSNTLYHVSDKKHSSLQLTPRIPDNFLTRCGAEDTTTKRISFCKSISDCLVALSQNLKGKTLYYYTVNMNKISKDNIITPSNKQVPDSKITHEVWVTCPVVAEYGGIVHVKDAKDTPKSYTYITSKGETRTADLYEWDYSTESFSYKSISFPKEEIPTISKQSRIITTRVSSDFKRLQLNDIVKTPWNQLYKITKRLVINDIKKHPYYKELTKGQIEFLSKYDEIAVLELTRQEASAESIIPRVSNNIKNNKVYHASPYKLDILLGKKTKSYSGEQGNVFVSPMPGIAACFIVNHQRIVDAIEKQVGSKHLQGLNFQYNVWSKDAKELYRIDKTLIVYIENVMFKPFKTKETGYIYTIDFSKYKDKCHMFGKAKDSDAEFCIEGDVEYEKCEPISLEVTVVPKRLALDKNSEYYAGESLKPKSSKVWTEDMINSVADLKRFYRDSRYGLIDMSTGRMWNETHNSTTGKDYDERWRLATVQQQLRAKGGICYDTVLFSIYFLNKWHIAHRQYFAYTKRSKEQDGYESDPTHTFLIYKDEDGKWKWLEGSWGPHMRNNLEESTPDYLATDIGKILSNAAHTANYISEITRYPSPGCNMNTFQHELLKTSPKWEIEPEDKYSKESLETSAISFREIDLNNKRDIQLAVAAVNLASKASGDDECTEKEVLDKLKTMKEKYHQELLAINVSSSLVGFARVGEYFDKHINKQAVAVMDFAIFEKYQGKGYGTSVLTKLIEYQKRKYPKCAITIGVAKSNKRAFHVYEKLGYVVVKEFKDSYLMQYKASGSSESFSLFYSTEKYDPPYNAEQMRKHGYSEEIIARLEKDPVHSWRMKTGIELIHIEPSKSELMRIWKNWNQMSAEQKKISEKKELELFGVTNKVMYEYLIPQYKVENPDRSSIHYPPRQVNSKESLEPSTEVLDISKIKTVWLDSCSKDLVKRGTVLLDKAVLLPGDKLNKEMWSCKVQLWPSLAALKRSITSTKHGAWHNSNYPYAVELDFKEIKDHVRISGNRMFLIPKSGLRLKVLNSADLTEVYRANKNIKFSHESLVSSTEAALPANFKEKRKKIEQHILNSMKLLDPHTDVNTSYWANKFKSMSDQDFDKFMHLLKEHKYNIHMFVPPLKVHLTNAELIDAAHKLNVELMHRLWMVDEATGLRYLTPEKYLVLQLPVRRQQQFLDEKISVPDNDKTIDGLTGQVTGDSKSCAITNPEIHIMQARNLDASLYEFVNVRGGNIPNYAEFKRSLEETGSVSLAKLDPNNRTRVSVMAGVILTGMHLDSNFNDNI